jgi:tetratricopeptide (TPR) repeat protein
LESEELPEIFMMFRANDDETSATVYEDEPLIFSVSMINDTAITARSYNFPLEERIQELERRFRANKIEEEEFRNAVEEIERGMMKVRVYRFGGPMAWPHFIKIQALSDDVWKDIDWPLWLLLYRPFDQVAELDDSTTCYVEFGLDPNDPNRPKGEIQIKATVNMFGFETLESNDVTVNFLKKKMPKAESEKEETIVAKGKYAFKRDLYDEAMDYAQGALKAYPISIPAQILLADIQEGRGNISAALSAYEKALEEFNKQYKDMREPPVFILAQINRLKSLLYGEPA